jgi:hypothetical protein
VPEVVSNRIPASARASVVPDDREVFIAEQTERLQQQALSDDPAALNDILLALTSPEKEIREAAIEATKQFGNTNAIPSLLLAADSARDLAEKTALLEAVEFLSLPLATFEGKAAPLTLEQVQAEEQRRALRRLRRQAREAEPPGRAQE